MGFFSGIASTVGKVFKAGSSAVKTFGGGAGGGGKLRHLLSHQGTWVSYRLHGGGRRRLHRGSAA